MPQEFLLFTAVLAVIWFVVYWVLGGVLFALLALLRLGRVRKVRFSCLFTALALVCSVGAAWYGMDYSQVAVNECLAQAQNRAETMTAVFGCGFVGIFGAFLIGAAVLVTGGWIILAISKTKTKPWITLESEEPPVPPSGKGNYF